jgi:hypothetical protein
VTDGRAFNEEPEREREVPEDSAEFDAMRRERDMFRKRNSRLCRKYGLANRRQLLRNSKVSLK